MSSRPSWIDELFRAIDAKDAERFASFIAADGTFLFGNAPAVAGFFASVRGLSHEVQSVAEDGGVRHYQIYVDASALYR